MKTHLRGEFPTAAALEVPTCSPESNASLVWPGTLQRGQQASTRATAGSTADALRCGQALS